jgi:integrase/recombinase XerD
LAAEEEFPDLMAGLAAPHVPGKPVPVFTDGDLDRLEHACAGRGFTQRRDAAMIAVLKATGIRLSELTGIRHHPDNPRRGDVDLWNREITVTGKGRKARVVNITARAHRAGSRQPAHHRGTCLVAAALAKGQGQQPTGSNEGTGKLTGRPRTARW